MAQVTFPYLATPYTDYPDGHEAAFREAARVAAWLATKGMTVYSPIAHSHPLAESGLLPKTDHDLWMRLDAPFMEAASSLIVVRMTGWDKSRGVTFEIAAFKRAGKPIFYMDAPA